MATAYASLVSLMNILDQIKIHPRFSSSLDKHQIESLVKEIDFFLKFLECCYSDGCKSKEVEELESQIVSAAHEAEDIIESYIVNQILPGSTEIVSDVRLHHRCLFSLQKVLQDMYSVKNKVLEIKEDGGFNYQKPANSTPAASSRTTGKSGIMVGFDDELKQLKDVLTRQKSSRQIVSIVGMGGTGKTTLARNVYESSLMIHHFDLRAWATISQEYDVRYILLQLLSFPGNSTNEDIDGLGELLHKKLFGRRYLIILDDMWSVVVWDKIKFFFPDNGNGSQVVLTTRLSNVATHLCSFCIRINFLDVHKSWDLFCQKVFGRENCPLELVGIGKKIVEQCKGLPLSIVVIGGFLRRSYRTTVNWQNAAKSIKSVLNSSENEHCLNILYLSYSHLPSHLKPCFVYMGIYREDYEINVSEMIRLWIAEGFLKSNGVQILEDIAEDYVKELVDRNLISVSAHCSNGKIKSCRIHDLLRELCLWIADKEKFFCVVGPLNIPRGMNRERRLIFREKTSRCNGGTIYHDDTLSNFKDLQSASLARSLICHAVEVPVECRLLRVLKQAVARSREAEIRNVNLRYIVYRPHWECSVLPSSISLIWNLQTLIIRANEIIVAPLEIWKMTQLRHLKCSDIVLPDPPPSDKEDDSVVLQNLQTLTLVNNFRLSDEACKRFPNIKKLGLKYDDSWCEDHLKEDLPNLGRLQRLESLRLWCYHSTKLNTLKGKFPSSLNKLCLGGCTVQWDDLSLIVGSLPRLEVLKLQDTFGGVTMCSFQERFLRLKFLSIESCSLESWTLESASYFPVLEKLVLIDVNLSEIPSAIGEISTLQLIRLENCNECTVISAVKIKKELESTFGNDGLKIQVEAHARMVEKLKEMVKNMRD